MLRQSSAGAKTGKEPTGEYRGENRTIPDDSGCRYRGSRGASAAQTGSVRPQTTARTVAPFCVVTVWTQPFGR